MKIGLLDNGYIELIESWGSDERIVESARMSTNKGFLGWGTEEKPGDERLLRYLWQHKHATPFEMAGATFEVQAPIMVFREWHRHRTQCLAGSTEITLLAPRGVVHKRTIKQIFDLKHGGVIDKSPERHRNGRSKAGNPVWREARRTKVLPNCQHRLLRTLDETTGEYRSGKMRDVWESGVKEVWELATDKGTVRSSIQHPFYTRSGWAELGDIRSGELIATSGRIASAKRAIPPALRQGISIWTTMMRSRLILPVDDCYVCNSQFAFNDLELDHVVPVSVDLRLALDEDNLRPICKSCHRTKINVEQPKRNGQCRLGLRWAKVIKAPERVSEEMTYDLEMIGPDHNYVANDLVVHNSYSELSARYTPLPDVNYTPSRGRLMQNACETNKQAGTVVGADRLTGDTAEEWRGKLHRHYLNAETLYQEGLRAGIPKELARLALPVGRYSRMRASANLRNWLAFLTLRLDPGAQQEIRLYAQALFGMLKDKFPRTMCLFEESLNDRRRG